MIIFFLPTSLFMNTTKEVEGFLNYHSMDSGDRRRLQQVFEASIFFYLLFFFYNLGGSLYPMYKAAKSV